MQTTEQLIQSAIDDLLNPSISLTDVLFKLQVIAFKIKNKELQDWVYLEMNGYKKDTPEYRRRPTNLFVDLYSSFGFEKNNYQFPIEKIREIFGKYTSKEKMDIIVNRYRTISIEQSVPEIIDIIENDEEILKKVFSLDDHQLICDTMKPEWQTSSIYQIITKNNYQGILQSIKIF